MKIHFNHDTSSSLINLFRETEILNWIADGKTNSEIAILHNITHRAVQKHVENTFTKPGVENRTAAALKIKEIIH